MTTKYIIKFRKVSDDELIDAYLVIDKKYNFSTINITTERDKFNPNNKTLLFEYIFNENLKISFNDEILESTINDYVIKFDLNSSSAWTNFKTELETIINTRNEIEKYPSGNIKCIGGMLYKGDIKVLDGNGTVFYDKSTNNIKYTGEFSNGLFDGGGVFYSLDGCITFKVNNISNGIPNRIGELIINYPNYQLTKEISFYSLWDKLYIHSNNEIITFVMSDKFVDTIAKSVWSNTKPLEEFKFDTMSIEDKYNLLLNKIKFTEKSIHDIKNDIFINFYVYLFLLVFLILLLIVVVITYYI